MTAPFFPAGAAEFPNDNPGLHDGARWVCQDTVGSVRALLRPRASGGAIPVVAPEVEPVPRAEPAPEPRFDGPLQLDLGRVLLLHRVEDIPPPPAFVFRPFVSSRRARAAEVEESVAAESAATESVASELVLQVPELQAAPALEGAAPVREGAAPALEAPAGEPDVVVAVELADAVRAAIAPRACHVVDQHEACRRVARGWRVDVAPCVTVGSGASPAPATPAPAVSPSPSGEGSRARVRRRSISTTRVLPPSALVVSLEQLLEAAIA